MEQEETAAHEDAADSQLMYRIERPVYDEAFIRTHLVNRKENSTTIRQRLAEKFQCSSKKAKAAALSFLPILTWLPSYPVKQYLLSDVVSGLSTGVVQLPQGLAYAMLAAVPPVYGLYSSFYPVLLYTFFGTSRHISVVFQGKESCNFLTSLVGTLPDLNELWELLNTSLLEDSQKRSHTPRLLNTGTAKSTKTNSDFQLSLARHMHCFRQIQIMR